MILRQFIVILLLIVCVTGFTQGTWSSKYVKLNKNGVLQYIPDEKGNIIPDFSRVGYHGNEKPILRVVIRLSPSEKSQQEIQEAIDELAKMPLAANGFRGAIHLLAGEYKIPGSIKINASGIVLRGDGDATKLIATGKGQRDLIQISGTGGMIETKGTRKKITDKYVPVGAKSFLVNSTEGYKKGDRIVVFRPGTANWIHDLQMDKIIVRDSTTRQWLPEEYNLHFERIITKIEKNRIYIDNPVVMEMDEKYGGGEIYKYSFPGRIFHVGIENMFLQSDFVNDTDEDHGWNAIFFHSVENGWVRNVTAKYFGYSCVNLGVQSKNITVDNCRYIEPKSQIIGARRYSFNNDGQLNLVMNCFSSEGRHDYVTGARVCGPNVFYNCRSENAKADIGAHHRWATGTLYDNIVTDGEINIQDRGNWGTGHGWAGATQVIWNCTASKAAMQDPWVSGKNYVVGLNAIPYDGRLKNRNASYWDGKDGKGLQPPSLYKAQLESFQKSFKKGIKK